jgi:hypothetical protein
MNVGRKYSGLDIFVVIVYGLAFLIVIFNICFVDPLSKKENIVIDYVGVRSLDLDYPWGS